MGRNHTGVVKPLGTQGLWARLPKGAGQEGRKVYLDDLRVLATVFVVCVHTLELARTQLAPGTLPFQLAEVFHFIFLSCNLLFLMISGALLLPMEGERTVTFLTKRFSKVAIPFFVYYILYVCAKEGLGRLAPGYWFTFLIRILSGPPIEAPHFWLIYVILWLYLLTPFLRYLLQNIPDGVLSGVVFVIFAVSALDTYLPLFGMDAHVSPIVDSYAGVFILGYYLSCRCTRRAENLMLAGGAISFAVTCYIFFSHGWYDAYVYNTAPTMMLFTAALFVAAKRLAVRQKVLCGLPGLISRYSFSILLIHWAALHVIVKDFLHINVMSGGVVWGCLVMIVLTLLFSLVGGMIIELVLVQPLQRALAACVRWGKRITPTAE